MGDIWQQKARARLDCADDAFALPTLIASVLHKCVTGSKSGA